jgi:hypothetical protein
VSARRRASGIRWRPAICRTSSAAPGRDIPAAVTYSGDEQVSALAFHATQDGTAGGWLRNPTGLILSMGTYLARLACISE